MDGIALRAKDTFGATETTPVRLTKEQFIVVDTGDLMPEGCDAVVMIEDVVWEEDGSVRLYGAAAPWQHIRQIGEDICAGEMILASYQKITPSAIGAMIAGGILEVDVCTQPVVGIIPTGDEIVSPVTDPAPGDILEFNGSIFSAMLKEWSAVPVLYPIVKDNFEEIKAMVEKALSQCDIVLLNAGSSAGREDFSSRVVAELGTVLYHGIAVKPGKPAILGCQGNKPILGVPGYPVSGIIVIEQILKPLLEQWNHTAADSPVYEEARLSRAVVSGLKYKEFVRVRLGYVNGELIASPLGRGSGVISSFMKADGMLEIPQETEGYETGAVVKVKLLRNKNELEHTLVAIGSHDPLLDELRDMIHTADNSLYMSSSHVGSMGGIMSVRRRENHIAGIHLLNEADGTYNISFLKKYFPQGGVKLVECVGRTQGIMVAGTRILLDYLCKKENLDTASIYGYEREEFTHTSVAAQIASGSADAGLGIYSAAMLYDLDFVPVCTEQYDLLIPDYAWDTPMVQKLLSILKSDAFRERLEKLGGYTLAHPGTIRYE